MSAAPRGGLARCAPLLRAMLESTKLVDAELVRLDEENERLAADNKLLRADREALGMQIASLERELADAREAVHELQSMLGRAHTEPSGVLPSDAGDVEVA